MANNINNTNNIVTGFDRTSRKTYNLFTFMDVSANENDSSIMFENNMVSLFDNYSPYVLSETASVCGITSDEKFNYEVKLNTLHNIITQCNDPSVTNKQDCLYGKFMNDNIVQTINELIKIANKINNTCIFKNVSAEDTNNICLENKNTMLNNYSSNDLKRNNDFLVKYSDIITQLKTIADTNVTDYLTKCSQSPERIETYKNVQDLLAKALFQSRICKPSPVCPDAPVCPATPVCPKVTFDTCATFPVIQDKIKNYDSLNDKYNVLSESSDSFIWTGTMSPRNGFLFFGIILILLVVIGVLIYYVSTRSNKDNNYNGFGNQVYRPY